MKAALALLCSVLAVSAATQPELEPRIPLKLAHLAQLKQKDPQKMFHVRTPGNNDVVGQISKVVLDAEGQRPKFAVLLLFENVVQDRRQIVVPWEALMIDTNHSEVFINASVEKLKQAGAVQAEQVPSRAAADWATQYYAFYGVEPRQAEPEPDAVGIASQISGTVKGSGSSQGSKPVVNVTQGNKTFLWLGLFLVVFGVAMLMRRLTRMRR
jgi:hypothetical protein